MLSKSIFQSKSFWAAIISVLITKGQPMINDYYNGKPVPMHKIIATLLDVALSGVAVGTFRTLWGNDETKITLLPSSNSSDPPTESN